MLSAPLTLESIESFFPERTVTVEEQSDELGLNPAQRHLFRKFHGLDTIRYDPEMSLYDLVLPPARRILEQTDPASIRYLVHARSALEVAPSTIDVGAEIRDRLGLGHATAFSVTHQNCASPLAAIDMVGELLRADGDPDARALIVTGEKAFTPILRGTYNTYLTGEGAAACLVARGGRGPRVRSYVSRTYGEYADGIKVEPALIQKFSDQRPRMMRELMTAAASLAGCTLDDIHLILPTNPNVTIWNETSRELGFPPGKIFIDNVARYSHCMSADTLINYVSLREEGLLEPGRNYMFVAIGVGFTFAAMVFTEGGR
ncbi:ketoacyl-ACP synthase III family protein [Kitasatospora sp. NPDC048239]|uniref:ketoacyl-ACP synthase III family protein n=1 Tax=Kitasatospora sp. NPDC048239 TaxID=3364046 RepID=UPI003716A2A5